MNVKLTQWLNTPKGKLVRKKVTATEARLAREQEQAELLRARALNFRKP